MANRSDIKNRLLHMNAQYDKNDPTYHAYKIAIKHCEPLFLSPPHPDNSHTASKENGTITYVRFKGVIYGITCAHIHDHQFTPHNPKRLTVHNKHGEIYEFGKYHSSGYKSEFHSLRSHDNTQPDISIARLNDFFYENHMKIKDKIPIDLDSWIEPEWEDLKTPEVYGFPTKMKADIRGYVGAKLLTVRAELTKTISPHCEEFLMASELEKENKYYFSGMSGGPVFCIYSSGRLCIIGIVYEGIPGSANKRKKSGSFFNDKQVVIKACKLSPEIFQNWLSIVGL